MTLCSCHCSCLLTRPGSAIWHGASTGPIVDILGWHPECSRDGLHLLLWIFGVIALPVRLNTLYKKKYRLLNSTKSTKTLGSLNFKRHGDVLTPRSKERLHMIKQQLACLFGRGLASSHHFACCSHRATHVTLTSKEASQLTHELFVVSFSNPSHQISRKPNRV